MQVDEVQSNQNNNATTEETKEETGAMTDKSKTQSESEETKID